MTSPSRTVLPAVTDDTLIDVDVWLVATSAGRDYLIQRPLFPRVYHLFVAGEHAGEYATLVEAISNAADLDATDDQGNHVPAHRVERTLIGPAARQSLPLESVDAEEWVEVVTTAHRGLVARVFDEVVGRLHDEKPELVAALAHTTTDFERGVCTALVPAVLADLVTDRLLHEGWGVQVRDPDSRHVRFEVDALFTAGSVR